MFNMYPYMNVNDLNLDYILKTIKTLRYEVTNFVALNAIKYADPIQWNITKQYEKNTIVIEPNTGTAYISAHPVPSGIAISNTDFWTVVFDLSEFITKGAANFANTYETSTTTTATMPTAKDGWVVWNSTLYLALTNISAGDAYVVGGNIQQMTVEDFFNILLEKIGDNAQAIIDEAEERANEDARIELELSDLITSKVGIEAHTRANEDARIELELSDLITSKVGIEAQTRADEDARIENELQNVIDNLFYTTPEEYGAVGDGVTDDSAAVQAAVNDGRVVYLRNEYAIDSIAITQDTTIIGSDTSKIYPNCVGATILFKNVFTATNCNLTLKNIHIVGRGRYASTGVERYTLIDVSSADYLKIENCSIDNVGHNYAQDTTSMNNYIPLWIKAVDVLNVNITGCTFSRGGSDELMMITPWSMGSPSQPCINITNNDFIDCDHGASLNLFAYNINIENNNFNNFVYPGSIFNLTGENVNCISNNFNACNVGSVFDGLEGCLFHTEHFNVLNNVFTGTCNVFAENVGAYTNISGNTVEADTLLVNEITVYSSNLMPSMLRNTKNRRLGKCVIENNVCRIGNSNTAVMRIYLVGANATSDIPYSDYRTQDSLIIRGNSFEFKEFFTANSKYFLNSPAIINSVCIEDNTIWAPNIDALSGNTKYLYYIDNRYINTIIKNLTFINNSGINFNVALSNGMRLYSVMDDNYPAVNMLTNISNNVDRGSVDIGSTNYQSLVTITPV